MSDVLNLALAIKSASDAGEIEGFAAVYGNVDTQGDRIEKGAFTADAGKEIPLLWQHKADQVVGVGTLEETPEGLRLKGRLLLDTQAGREAYSRVKAGAVKGLSVGFRLLKHAWDGAVRVVQAGAVAEVSLTAFPANPAAAITAVKEENPYRVLARAARPDWNLWS